MIFFRIFEVFWMKVLRRPVFLKCIIVVYATRKLRSCLRRNEIYGPTVCTSQESFMVIKRLISSGFEDFYGTLKFKVDKRLFEVNAFENLRGKNLMQHLSFLNVFVWVEFLDWKNTFFTWTNILKIYAVYCTPRTFWWINYFTFSR